MGKVITIRFRRSRLPRRLLNDGWWLESKPVRPTVVALPKFAPTNRIPPNPRKSAAGHLTLVKPEK
jgi:hypothetical protein